MFLIENSIHQIASKQLILKKIMFAGRNFFFCLKQFFNVLSTFARVKFFCGNARERISEKYLNIFNFYILKDNGWNLKTNPSILTKLFIFRTIFELSKKFRFSKSLFSLITSYIILSVSIQIRGGQPFEQFFCFVLFIRPSA